MRGSVQFWDPPRLTNYMKGGEMDMAEYNYVVNGGVESDPYHGVESDPYHGVESDPYHGVETDPYHGVEDVPYHKD